MSCSGFEKYQLGEWSEGEFEAHRQTCDECRVALERDKKLIQEAAQLKINVEVHGLWGRIENELQKESGSIKRLDNYRWVWRIAAVLVLALGIGFVIRSVNRSADSGLLADSALKRVEAQEKAYEAAIDDLEKIIAPKLSSLDQELMLLYRDRLETIDAQIEHCKEALAMNPANAHIRRYLLAALRDKKETLKEIQTLGTGSRSRETG